MRQRIDLVLYTTLLALLPAGCRRQAAEPKLIFNIPGPEVPKYHKEWEPYEYRFLSEISPKKAMLILKKLGYRFLTPEEEPLADEFIWQQTQLANMSMGMFYLEHPIIVLFQPKNTNDIYIMGFDQGMFPRQMRGFYDEAKLGEEYGWLVMRERAPTD